MSLGLYFSEDQNHAIVLFVLASSFSVLLLFMKFSRYREFDFNLKMNRKYQHYLEQKKHSQKRLDYLQNVLSSIRSQVLN